MLDVEQHRASALPADAKLIALGKAAREMEAVLREAAGVLDAIFLSGMLDATPADEHDAQLHNTACILLDMLRNRVRQHEESPGTDLSIMIDAMR